jgi:hypothetical protein
MSELPVYPDAPGFKTPGPSEQAARTVAGLAAKLRVRVLAEIARHSIGGATADEVAQALGSSILNVRPRVSELNRAGKIVQTGARRKNDSGMTATVWRIASQRQGTVGSQT